MFHITESVVSFTKARTGSQECLASALIMANCRAHRRTPSHGGGGRCKSTKLSARWTVIVEFHLLDGVTRLRYSCMFSRMMGLPCRHMCAINKGASIEDVALRWLNAVARGELDELLFDFRSRPKTYPGAVQSEAALQWYVNPLQFHSTTITPSCNDTTATPQSHNPTILQSNNLAISQPCNLTILQRGEAS